MNPQDVFTAHLRESIRTKERLLAECGPAVEAAGRLMARAIAGGHKVLFCGNGGSAADSQHFATELVVRLSSAFERPALPALALTTDTSLITACANDYSFDDIFSRQVEGLGQAGDVLVGISTSGKSENVRRALQRARERQLGTVLLAGGDGGTCRALADAPVVVPSKVTAHIQECHLAIGHVLCELIERLACDRPDGV